MTNGTTVAATATSDVDGDQHFSHFALRRWHWTCVRHAVFVSVCVCVWMAVSPWKWKLYNLIYQNVIYSFSSFRRYTLLLERRISHKRVDFHRQWKHSVSIRITLGRMGIKSECLEYYGGQFSFICNERGEWWRWWWVLGVCAEQHQLASIYKTI